MKDATFRDRYIIGILAVSALLSLLEITWGLPAAKGHGWDVDTIAPVGPLAAAAGGFTRIPETFVASYPLFHYMITAICYVPYLLYLLLSGGISLPPQTDYPFGLLEPQASLSNLILVSRLISAAMAVGIVAIWYRITYKLFDRRSALIAAFLTATGYTFVYYAHTGNLDIPYLFWTSLALERLVYLQCGDGKRPYLWFGIFSALAIATKDQAYGYFALTFPYLVILRWKAYPPLLRGLFWRDVNLAHLIGGFVVAYGLATNLFLNPQYFLKHIHNVLYVSKYGSISSDFFSARIELITDVFRGLIHCYGIPLIGVPLVIIGIVSIFRWFRPLNMLLIPVISYFLTFLLLVGYSFDRFVLGIFFVINVAAGHTISEWIKHGHRFRAICAGIACMLLLTSAFHLPRLLAHDSRYEVEQFLRQATRANSNVWVYSLGQEDFSPRIPAKSENVRYVTYQALPDNIKSPPDSRADFIVFVYDFPPGEGGERRDVLEVFLKPNSGFSLAYEAKTRYLLDPDSLPFVNPQLYVFQRL